MNLINEFIEKPKHLKNNIFLPLKPDHSGNFLDYKLEPGLTTNVLVNCLYVSDEGCLLVGRNNGIIDVFNFGLKELDKEKSINQNRTEYRPTHSTSFHPPFNFNLPSAPFKFDSLNSTSFSVSTLYVLRVYSLETLQYLKETALEDRIFDFSVRNKIEKELDAGYKDIVGVSLMKKGIKLVDWDIKLPIMSIGDVAGGLNSLAWCPKSNVLLCGGGLDNRLLFYDIRQPKYCLPTQGFSEEFSIHSKRFKHEIISLAFTPDNFYIFTQHYRRHRLPTETSYYLCIWQFDNGKLLKKIELKEETDDPIVEEKNEKQKEYMGYSRLRRKRPNSEQDETVKEKDISPISIPASIPPNSASSYQIKLTHYLLPNIQILIEGPLFLEININMNKNGVQINQCKVPFHKVKAFTGFGLIDRFAATHAKNGGVLNWTV